MRVFVAWAIWVMQSDFSFILNLPISSVRAKLYNTNQELQNVQIHSNLSAFNADNLSRNRVVEHGTYCGRKQGTTSQFSFSAMFSIFQALQLDLTFEICFSFNWNFRLDSPKRKDRQTICSVGEDFIFGEYL